MKLRKNKILKSFPGKTLSRKEPNVGRILSKARGNNQNRKPFEI